MTIASRFNSRMAAGPTPSRIASASVALPELDPRPAGIISTRPASSSAGLRVPAIDDAACRRIEAAPEAERFLQEQGGASPGARAPM